MKLSLSKTLRSDVLLLTGLRVQVTVNGYVNRIKMECIANMLRICSSPA